MFTADSTVSEAQAEAKLSNGPIPFALTILPLGMTPKELIQDVCKVVSTRTCVIALFVRATHRK